MSEHAALLRGDHRHSAQKGIQEMYTHVGGGGVTPITSPAGGSFVERRLSRGSDVGDDNLHGRPKASSFHGNPQAASQATVNAGAFGRDAQPALVIGRHYMTERDSSAPVQYNGIL